MKKPRMPRSGRPFFFNRTLAGFVGWHLQVRDQIVASTGQQVVSARTKFGSIGTPKFWDEMDEDVPKNHEKNTIVRRNSEKSSHVKSSQTKTHLESNLPPPKKSHWIQQIGLVASHPAHHAHSENSLLTFFGSHISW